MFNFAKPLNQFIGNNENGIRNTNWERHETRTKHYFAVFATIILIIGCEFSTPGYSATGLVYDYFIKKSETIVSITHNKKLIELYQQFITPTDQKEDLNIVKVMIFFTLFILTSLHYFLNDPLSSKPLLRRLASEKTKAPYFFRFLPKVRFYALNCPSNLLPTRCSECAINGCPNHLTLNHAYRSHYWEKIFINLDKLTKDRLMKTIAACRGILYFRYSLLSSSVALIFLYLIIRSSEYYFTQRLNLNAELIIYTSALFLLFLLIGYFNKANSTDGGVWAKYKDAVSNLLISEEYAEQFDKAVCKRNDMKFDYAEKKQIPYIKSAVISGQEIQSLVTVINVLDRVSKIKLKRFLSRKNAAYDINSLRNIIDAIVEIFYTLNHEQCRFRAALFVPHKSGAFLVPLVDTPFTEQQFITSNYRHFLSRSGPSSAAIAWSTESIDTRSGSEIIHFHEEQEKYLKSIISIPIVVEKEIIDLFIDNDIFMDSVIGVVCIDCDCETVFKKESIEINEILIKPFVNRIMYEMLYSLSKKEGL